MTNERTIPVQTVEASDVNYTHLSLRTIDRLIHTDRCYHIMEYQGIITYHTVNGDAKNLSVQLLEFLISVTEGSNLCKYQALVYQNLIDPLQTCLLDTNATVLSSPVGQTKVKSKG